MTPAEDRCPKRDRRSRKRRSASAGGAAASLAWLGGELRRLERRARMGRAEGEPLRPGWMSSRCRHYAALGTVPAIRPDGGPARRRPDRTPKGAPLQPVQRVSPRRMVALSARRRTEKSARTRLVKPLFIAAGRDGSEPLLAFFGGSRPLGRAQHRNARFGPRKLLCRCLWWQRANQLGPRFGSGCVPGRSRRSWAARFSFDKPAHPSVASNTAVYFRLPAPRHEGHMSRPRRRRIRSGDEGSTPGDRGR